MEDFPWRFNEIQSIMLIITVLMGMPAGSGEHTDGPSHHDIVGSTSLIRACGALQPDYLGYVYHLSSSHGTSKSKSKSINSQ